MRGRVGSLLEVGTGFHPDLTGRENIYLSGTILGMKKREIDRKLDEIIAFAEIERFLDTPVKRYSSGMNVRLGFSVVAHLEPEILVVDEVLSVGDSAFQKKCLGKMGSVARDGRTVLFVSHNTATMLRLCSRAILLEAGRVSTEGAVEGVIRAYLAKSGLTRNQVKVGESRSGTGFGSSETGCAKITNAQGGSVSTVPINESLHIHYRYYVPLPEASFRCVANFHTQGVAAFTSMESQEVVRRETGYYESVLVIPGNLLVEGDYSIDISIFSSRGSKIRHLYLSDALSVHVFDPMTGNSSRGDYAERYSGVLRPLLPWQMTFLGNSLPREIGNGSTGRDEDLPQNLTDAQYMQKQFQR